MVRLKFLGTGCGYPVPDRFYSSILIEGTEARLLLDAGEPCSQLLCAAGVGLETIDAILISHGHSDHVGGLPMVLQGTWLSPRKAPLPICMPAELIPPFRAWLDAVYLPESLLGFPIMWHGWETEGPYAWRGVRVTVSPTTHLHSLAERIAPADSKRFKAYSMAIAIDGLRLVYSGDLGAPDDMLSLFSEPVDVLVCELSHFTPEELFGFLAGKPVGRIILTHLSPAHQIGEEKLSAIAHDLMGSEARIHLAIQGETVEIG